jgi:hypothetical protein
VQGFGSAPEPGWLDAVSHQALHGLAGEFVATIAPHSEADPVALLTQFLVGFGNMVGRGPHFVAEADRHGVNLFLGLVGATAKGRKGSAWGHVLRLLRSSDGEWAGKRVQSGLSSGEGVIWGVRDAIDGPDAAGGQRAQRGQGSRGPDPGVVDKRLLVVEPEFVSTLKVMGRSGNTLSPLLRQAWDIGDLRILNKNSPAIATGAHISVIGHITRDELRRELDETELGNGFANRFLWACVRRSKALPEGGDVSKVDFGPILRSLSQAAEFAQVVGRIDRDDAARTLWAEVYPALSEGRPGLLGAVTSRAEAQVMRLACVYALLDRSPLIRTEHLEAALALWRYCEASCRHIFGRGLGDAFADRILAALRAAPAGLARAKVYEVFSGHADRAAIERALVTLERKGLARREVERTAGRPAERWFAGSQLTQRPREKDAREGSRGPLSALLSLFSHGTGNGHDTPAGGPEGARR